MHNLQKATMFPAINKFAPQKRTARMRKISNKAMRSTLRNSLSEPRPDKTQGAFYEEPSFAPLWMAVQAGGQ